MVKTGITRRIDELGRIVIPKEIRKNLKIKDSDELDIMTDGENIILNKHEININDIVIDKLLYVIGKNLSKNVLLTSKDKIISYYMINKEKINKLELSNEIVEIIDNRKKISSNNIKIKCFENYTYIINPIVINGDLFGSIIIYGDNINSNDEIVIDFCQKFLENYLE